MPIPHATLVEQVESALTNQGLRIVEQGHALAAGGTRYFGFLQVANGQASNEYAYVVGLRNSHDQSFPAGLVVGANCFICDNLSFNGEIKIARRHTSRIREDLPILTTRAVGMLSDKWNTMDQRIAAYREHEMGDALVHDFIIRAMDGGACTPAQIPRIVNEWRNPRHPEFAENRTAWRLFNAFTEIGKESSLWALPKRTINLHAMLDAEVGLVPAERQITEGVEDAEVEVQQN
jgi:hypothetical protein